MKNLLCCAVTAALGYFAYDALQTPPAPPQAAVIVAPVPAPVPAPKVYFHSSLDAPAMPTSAHTAMGYYSTERTSEFNGGYASSGYDSSVGYLGGGSTELYVPYGQTTTRSTFQTNASGVSVGTAKANQMMSERAAATAQAAAVRQAATGGQATSPSPIRTW